MIIAEFLKQMAAIVEACDNEAKEIVVVTRKGDIKSIDGLSINVFTDGGIKIHLK